MCRINKIYFACDHSHTVRISQCQAQKTHTARGLYLHEREELYVSCRAEDLSLIINLPGLCGKCLRVGPAAALLNTRNAIQSCRRTTPCVSAQRSGFSARCRRWMRRTRNCSAPKRR